MSLKKIIAVIGPTASGKTNLAIKIAKKYSGEVLSADSMQIYKQLEIGTAKPSKEEMDNVEHHLVGTVDVHEHYSVADYVDDAKEEIDKILANGNMPVLCGGTGLYVDSLLSSTKFEEIKSDLSIRNKYLKFAQDFGNEKLYDKLREVDPKAAEKIHYNNLVRVIRALEVYEITGERISDLQERSHDGEPEYDVLYLGLNFRNRDTLYERINRRVDLMMDGGLIEEAKFVFDDEDAQTARQAIGYKEFFPYFKGECSIEESIDLLKKESRHYAKRQLTWFLRNENVHWLYVDDYSDYNDLLLNAFSIIEKWSGNEE